MKMLRVEWIDSGMSIQDGWQTPQELVEAGAKDGMVAVTIGFLLHEDDDVLIVTQTFDPALGQHMNGQVILRSCVRKMDTLAVSTPAFATHLNGAFV